MLETYCCVRSAQSGMTQDPAGGIYCFVPSLGLGSDLECRFLSTNGCIVSILRAVLLQQKGLAGPQSIPETTLRKWGSLSVTPALSPSMIMESLHPLARRYGQPWVFSEWVPLFIRLLSSLGEVCTWETKPKPWISTHSTGQWLWSCLGDHQPIWLHQGGISTGFPKQNSLFYLSSASASAC